MRDTASTAIILILAVFTRIDIVASRVTALDVVDLVCLLIPVLVFVFGVRFVSDCP